MNERKKIDLHTSILDTIVLLSEGNPGAVTVLAQMMKSGNKNFLLLLGLDDMNIRGWQVWVGYKDYCGCDLDKFMECIRNRDSGMIDKINEGAIRCGESVRAITGGASFNR